MPGRPLSSRLRGRPTPGAGRAGAVLGLVLAVLFAGMMWPMPTSARPPAADTPLSVTLNEMDAVSLNGSGPVRLSGTVTNRTDETIDEADVYPMLGAAPITSEAELDEQTALPEDAYVGDRILTEGAFDTVTDLEPGQMQRWSIRLPRSEIDRDDPGVYWLGAHAVILDGENPRLADGRARTFVPLIDDARAEPPRTKPDRPTRTPDGPSSPSNNQPQKKAQQEHEANQVSFVLPLRRRVLREGDGRVARVEDWADALGPNGRLGRLLTFAEESGRLTWLLDPAVLDAVRQLAAGNPTRHLGASPDEDDPTASEAPSDDTEVDPSEDPSADSTDSETVEPADETAAEAQQVAEAWLEQLPDALAGHEVLALPYGDPDLPSIASNRPALYEEARERGQLQLDALEIDATPAVAPPSGYLDKRALRMLSDDPTVLLSDTALGGPTPARVRVAGQTIVTTSSLASAGGPGPGRPHAPVAQRQQAVAVAALRENKPEENPVVVMLPDGWPPPRGGQDLLGPFDAESWVELSGVTEATSTIAPTKLPASQLDYPESEADDEIADDLYTTFGDLLDAGETLQHLLTNNDEVAGEILDEVLTSVSYAARDGSDLAASATLAEVSHLLGSIRIEAPRGVMLSSAKGDFAVGIINELPEPVTVNLVARARSSMQIIAPDEPIEVAANSRGSVLLSAEADSDGVHQVSLSLTDTEGTPVGSGDVFPIRNGQVSTIIWWFIGGGSALLFGAIAIRLVRRFRHRHDPDPEQLVHE